MHGSPIKRRPNPSQFRLFPFFLWLSHHQTITIVTPIPSTDICLPVKDDFSCIKPFQYMGKNVGLLFHPNVVFITAWQSNASLLLIYFKKILCLYNHLKISEITINDIDDPQQICMFPLGDQPNNFGWQLMQSAVVTNGAAL